MFRESFGHCMNIFYLCLIFCQDGFLSLGELSRFLRTWLKLRKISTKVKKNFSMLKCAVCYVFCGYFTFGSYPPLGLKHILIMFFKSVIKTDLDPHHRCRWIYLFGINEVKPPPIFPKQRTQGQPLSSFHINILELSPPCGTYAIGRKNQSITQK